MITKKQFEQSYKKFLPSPCELFYLKHISITSLSQNKWPALFTVLGLMLPLLITIAAKVFGLPHIVFTVSSFAYVIILMLIGIYSLSIWNERVYRINSVCKDLNISKKDYEKLVNMYYHENYYPDIKDYINSILPEDK